MKFNEVCYVNQRKVIATIHMLGKKNVVFNFVFSNFIILQLYRGGSIFLEAMFYMLHYGIL